MTEISSQQHTFFNASREFKLLFHGGSDSHATRISICAILYIGMVANIALNKLTAAVGGELRVNLLCLQFCCRSLLLWRHCRCLQNFHIAAS